MNSVILSLLSRRLQAAYISFDLVPSPKGAATHIEAFAQALAAFLGRLDLITVSNHSGTSGPVERWPGVIHTELPATGASLIDRVICFRRFLSSRLAPVTPDVIQFRSIFEGFPLTRISRRPLLVFEVNGLPSIELKYRYPAAADDRELMRKIVAQENACLHAADRIVTPSSVTRDYLVTARGVESCKIRIVPNGVDTEIFSPGDRPTQEDRRLLYFGTLASWQGIDAAIRALAQIRQNAAMRLTIIGPGTVARRESLLALASKLGLRDFVEVLPAVSREELATIIRGAFAVMAPLAINQRNVVQGCCPLKVLEGMSAGVPVIASDLPVVHELGEHRTHLLTVKAGSVTALAGAVLDLHNDPGLWRKISSNARAHILKHYTWNHAAAKLAGVYRELGLTASNND